MPKVTAWKDEYLFEIYDLAKTGMTRHTICQYLGISDCILQRWIRDKPVLQTALKRASVHTLTDKNTPTFLDYVYQRMTPETKEVWDKLNLLDSEGATTASIEAILRSGGKILRQHLFIHAYVSSNFNASEACRKVNIPKFTLKLWMDRDPDFQECFEQINWHKGNFFEDALIRKVQQGDTACILHANRTFNRERGYGDRVEHKVSGKIENEHKFDWSTIPIELREQLYDSMTKEKPRELMASNDSITVIPAHTNGEVVHEN